MIIGEEEDIRQSRGIVSILQHFDMSVQQEATDRNPATRKPHLEAMQKGIMPALLSAQTWLKMGHFELPDYLQASRDRARRQINAATRKRSLTDEDLRKLAEAMNAPVEALQNIRDYYEETGTYAKQQQPKPALVTL